MVDVREFQNCIQNRTQCTAERLLAIDAADPLQHLPGFIVITTIEEPHGTLLADCHF